MSVFTTVCESVNRRIAYNRTLKALSSLPLNSRLDLNLYEGDLPKIAHRAVYGN